MPGQDESTSANTRTAGGLSDWRDAPDDAMNTVWTFSCSACGKCCNSPPRLSVQELFRHRNRFIGALAVRRIERPRLGATVETVAGRHEFARTDVLAYMELAEALLFPAAGSDSDFALLRRASSIPSGERCRALNDDGQCGLHDSDKPEECASVPFDALVPDRLQPLVLAARSVDGDSFGSHCIVGGPSDGFPVIARDGQVVAPALAEALARRRTALADDKKSWGNAVFAMMYKDCFAPGASCTQLPAERQLTLSPMPILMAIAAERQSAHHDTLDYIEAQLRLIDRKSVVRPCKTSGRMIGRTTRQLRAWAHAYRALGKSLGAKIRFGRAGRLTRRLGLAAVSIATHARDLAAAKPTIRTH